MKPLDLSKEWCDRCDY